MSSPFLVNTGNTEEGGKTDQPPLCTNEGLPGLCTDVALASVIAKPRLYCRARYWHHLSTQIVIALWLEAQGLMLHTHITMKPRI